MNVTKKNIPFSKIRVTGFNPRKNLKNDKIKKSIITDGFDPSFPLVVLECEDGFFDLIRGHCRHYIIGEIKVESPAVYKDKSLDKLPAVVYTGLSRSQVVEIMLDHQSDKDRKKLSILENACALKLYISEVNKKHTQESLSARFRVARTVIQKWQAAEPLGSRAQRPIRRVHVRARKSDEIENPVKRYFVHRCRPERRYFQHCTLGRVRHVSVRQS